MYALIPDIKNKKIMSLGCGSGEDSSYLEKLGAEESVGIDISSELIKIAKESYPQCSFEVMDMEHSDFPDSNFGFVYSSLAIHYIENWTQVFKEVYRILMPNSYFLFSCGNPVKDATGGNYLERIKFPGSLSVPGKDGVTVWHKSFGEIASEIKSSGFLIEQIVEPKPLKELKSIPPETYKKLNKIPKFVIFRLLKLGN